MTQNASAPNIGTTRGSNQSEIRRIKFPLIDLTAQAIRNKRIPPRLGTPISQPSAHCGHVVNPIVPFNPAAAVRGPKDSVRESKTSILSGEETRQLFASFSRARLAYLRDRALLGVMVYSFARARTRKLPVAIGAVGRQRPNARRRVDFECRNGTTWETTNENLKKGLFRLYH